jgi:hypothetical protein
MEYNKELVSKIDSYCTYPFAFDIYEDEEEMWWDFQIRAEKDFHASVSRGISKCCFAFDDLDYVVKKGFDGYIGYEECWEYDEDEDEDNRESYLREYYNDSCNIEYELYLDFCKDGIGKFFAETLRDGDVYIQEKVIPLDEVEDNNWDAEYDALSSAEKDYYKNLGYNYGMAYSWLYAACKCYGYEETENFLEKAENDYDFDILSDMHNGNYGYRASDNTPCILDFSGYPDED